jgi:hypothetical protein
VELEPQEFEAHTNFNALGIEQLAKLLSESSGTCQQVKDMNQTNHLPEACVKPCVHEQNPARHLLTSGFFHCWLVLSRNLLWNSEAEAEFEFRTLTREAELITSISV